MAPHGRAIAPDLIGFGKSDKPDIPYRFFDHADYLDGFIEALGLKNITLVLHDWGSGLGFHYARRHPDNVARLAFMEAILRPARWKDFPPGGFRIGFKMFRTPAIGWAMISGLNMFLNTILPKATVRKLTKEERAFYAAPFRSIKSRKPVLQWPREIPIEGKPADVHEAVSAYSAWLCETPLPKLFLTARPGGLCPAAVVDWARENMKNLEVADIGKGVHYVQEDNPHGIGRELAAWLQRLTGDQ